MPGQGKHAGQGAGPGRGDLAGDRLLGRHADGRLPASTRPEVDPKRIGCVGISMGGYRAIYLSALDDRIAAGCVAGFMSTVKPMIKAHIDTHSWVHFLPGLHRFLDLPDVASLAAPQAPARAAVRSGPAVPACGHEGSGRARSPRSMTRPVSRTKFHGPILRCPTPVHPDDAGRRLCVVRRAPGSEIAVTNRVVSLGAFAHFRMQAKHLQWL